MTKLTSETIKILFARDNSKMTLSLMTTVVVMPMMAEKTGKLKSMKKKRLKDHP